MFEHFFEGKRVAVTGALGTVGRAMVRELLKLPVSEVRSIDHNENLLFFFDQEYREEQRVTAYLADVRDLKEVERLFQGIDYVFHTAAYKHVPLCERSPFQTVQTNIIGVQNVIEAALACRVKKVLFTSSDKAVNPTNVMGTTKLMGERLMTAAKAIRSNDSETVFASCRFGNIVGSNGSVVPLFCKQIRDGGPVTLTHPDMTRFIMTLEQSVLLVMESIVLSRGGEVFVTKAVSVSILDLAKVLIDLVAPLYGLDPESIELLEVGPRPGEKMYEELMNEEEVRRCIEGERMFLILPPEEVVYGVSEEHEIDAGFKKINKVYKSINEPVLKREKIRELLNQPGILPDDVEALRQKRRPHQ